MVPIEWLEGMPAQRKGGVNAALRCYNVSCRSSVLSDRNRASKRRCDARALLLGMPCGVKHEHVAAHMADGVMTRWDISRESEGNSILRCTMRTVIGILLLALATEARGQTVPRSARSPREFIPAGYLLFEEIQGDLNMDGQADYVFVIKATDKRNIVTDEHRGRLDRNPRGIVIAFRKGDRYELVLENRHCFSSENEDGGVYYAPELNVGIEKGILVIHYAHGRYGYWKYKFRYQRSDFELIGYDQGEHRGPVQERMTSINLSTRKMQVRENVNANAQGGDEIFKETWTSFALAKPIRMRDIVRFDEFNVQAQFLPTQDR